MYNIIKYILLDLRIGEKYHIRILIIISLYLVSEYNF